MAAPFEEALQQVCAKFGEGFTLKSMQKEALEHVWGWNTQDKRDLIVNLPTGYGKSVIFQMIPDLLSLKSDRHDIERAVVLVVCPLNIIQADQQERLRDLGKCITFPMIILIVRSVRLCLWHGLGGSV